MWSTAVTQFSYRRNLSPTLLHLHGATTGGGGGGGILTLEYSRGGIFFTTAYSVFTNHLYTKLPKISENATHKYH